MYQQTDSLNFGISNYSIPNSVRIVLESINVNESRGNFERFETDSLREAYDWLRILIIKKTQDLHEQYVDYETRLIQIIHNEVISRWKIESEQVQTEQLQTLYTPVKEEQVGEATAQIYIREPVAIPEPVTILDDSPKEKMEIPKREKAAPTILDLITKAKKQKIKPKPKQSNFFEKLKLRKNAEKKVTTKTVKIKKRANKKQKASTTVLNIKQKFPDPETFTKLLMETKKIHKLKITPPVKVEAKIENQEPTKVEPLEPKVKAKPLVIPEKFKNLPLKQARRKALKEQRNAKK